MRVGRRGEALGMPTPPVFLADSRVLSAHDRRLLLVPRDADVAADAFAHVVEAPVLDLARKKRICDARTCDPDYIDNAAANRRCHRIGTREPPDAYDPLGRVRPHQLDEFQGIPLLEEPRRTC